MTNPQTSAFSKIEKMMPDLLGVMRKDLVEYPLKREFVLLRKSWVYNTDEKFFLGYYYEDHEELDGKITILCNHRLIVDITNNNVKRYKFTEAFVDYLTKE